MVLQDSRYGSSTATLFPALALCSFITLLVYRALLHPLRAVPGPLICKFTSLWTYYHSYIGDECTRIDELHKQYGPIVRIAPNEVVLSDGAALAPIYSERGGFLKASCYSNFDIEGHSTIFSELDPSHRAKRSKAVVPLFSLSNVRGAQGILQKCIDRWIQRLKEDAQASREANSQMGKSTKVNVLNLNRMLALDAVSSYLFGQSFDIGDEKGGRMTASRYVDVLVSFGRFFFLPNWCFVLLEQASARLFPDPEVDWSTAAVGTFTRVLAENAVQGDQSYQGRLRNTGITNHEIEIQCKDVIFAGTDSTGMNLSVLCWNLAKQPEIYAKLRAEVAESDKKDPEASPQSISYLDAVVREGLRLAMANPTRLPRVVPPQGWTYTTPDRKATYSLPFGTLVGIQIFTLHHNPTVFPEPHGFNPQRWLENVTPEMQRDFIPFGLGQRQCIARNLAHTELFLATRALAREGVLEGAKTFRDKVEILQWFNSRVIGERIDLAWT